MAWNPAPKVADCREIARKWKRKQVIIIAVGEDTLEYSSYGETQMLCKEARSMADVAYDAIYKTLSIGGLEESMASSAKIEAESRAKGWRDGLTAAAKIFDQWYRNNCITAGATNGIELAQRLFNESNLPGRGNGSCVQEYEQDTNTRKDSAAELPGHNEKVSDAAH